MKREQSRAGSRFAECEKSRLKAKILITLALLLTAVTGAWADTDGVKLTTAELVPTPAWDGNYNDMALSDMPGLTADGITEEQAKAWSDVPKSGNVDLIYGYVEHETYMDYKIVQFLDGEFLLSITKGVTYQSVFNDYSQSNKTYYATGVASAEAPITVAWDASTKTGTFSMPGSDVVLTPQYAPAAQLDENGAPAAVSGLEIAADAAIITAGQSAQGTLLYAVTTSDTEKPALTAFSATLPNAKDLTAAGTYYVWYYIQGHDTPQGQEPSADNTFNDSEIMGPVTVELLTNEHTLNIKQSPNITVTVAGTAKTPTDDKVTPVTTGQEVKIKAKEGYKFRKVEVKKKEAKLPKYADVVKICDMDADGKYLISSFFDGTNANFTTITKEEAIALAEYLGGGDIRVVFEEKESYGNRYARVTNAAGDTDGVTLSTTNTLSVPLYYVPAGN